MMQEVMERVELIVSVQGSRQISRENLDFLFEKYELPEEDRRKVLDYCGERGIRVFSELPERENSGIAGGTAASPGVPGLKSESGPASKPEPRGGLLSRLFGRR